MSPGSYDHSAVYSLLELEKLLFTEDAPFGLATGIEVLFGARSDHSSEG